MGICGLRDSHPLVSILTPCYNMEGYISRLLNSVLEQDYPAIEMFVIDDGSTDGSIQKIESFIKPFNNKHYALSVIKQQHSGQSFAIKNGLKYISGKYLVWPDADDYYACEKAISEMVYTLENSEPDVKMVRTQEKLLQELTLKVVAINGIHAEEDDPGTLFEDCLFGKNGYYSCPGAYMVDAKALFEETDFDIYADSFAGQNWQLMLPILYKYKCKTILKPYYNVICRESSHSRGYKKDYEESELRINSYYQTLVNTISKIKEMPSEKKENYISKLKEIYGRKQFRAAVKYGNCYKIKQYYHDLKAIGSTKITEDIVFVLAKLHVLTPFSFICRNMAK